MSDIFWCIGGGVLQIPVIEKARELGYSVLITDGSPNCVCANIADEFFNVDIFDIEAHLELATRLSAKYTIAGVLAAGIDAPMTMSALCEHLGLPGVPLSISETVHFKSKFREFSLENGIDTPKFSVFNESNLADLSKELSKFSLPFIIKNVDSSGSRGTKIFYERNNQEELRIAKEAIKCSKSKSFLVESVWTGIECTVETLFDINGEFYPCFITDRIFDYTSGFPIEIGLISPSQLPIVDQEACFELAHKVAKKLGITIGAAKFDMMVTKDGPKIIEMTTRLSGGFDCQYLVPASSGKNVIAAAILTACGKKFSPHILQQSKRLTAVTVSHWPPDGKIKFISGVREAQNLDGICHIFFRKTVGDIVQGYNDCADRVSFIIAVGEDLREAQLIAQNALDLIKIEVHDS